MLAESETRHVTLLVDHGNPDFDEFHKAFVNIPNIANFSFAGGTGGVGDKLESNMDSATSRVSSIYTRLWCSLRYCTACSVYGAFVRAEDEVLGTHEYRCGIQTDMMLKFTQYVFPCKNKMLTDMNEL